MGNAAVSKLIMFLKRMKIEFKLILVNSLQYVQYINNRSIGMKLSLSLSMYLSVSQPEGT